MIEFKIEKDSMEKLIVSGNPMEISAEVLYVATCILKNVGDEDVKEAMYEGITKGLTDETSPAYQEIFPDRKENVGFSIKDIFRGRKD